MTTKSTPDILDRATLGDAAPLPHRRRHRVVVDARYQMRSGILVGSIALVLLALLNASLVVRAQGAAIAERGAPWLRGTGGAGGPSWVILVVGSAIFLGGAVLLGVLESHRTAGAAYAIRRSIEAIRDGRTGERVRLRKHDHLKDLADAVNRLAESLDAERATRS